ncbi:hypothetical protein GDO81_006845 [Engystomops pustulosus]|uniref:Uncharacterized protein n=1 Tax=Engystomops pustulosus TaxID=76066 RepID=A0AAV6YNN6_ENGPU|nr:hypothetical protein GDO81_024726 [Engystomops pustulosus]KAG8590688.1 hypothetical protein GDO81_006845 [Engystomops pustulosus]KAG8590689.1 hypothetical protein GDO81_006845 [Engystomops pustulosus]
MVAQQVDHITSIQYYEIAEHSALVSSGLLFIVSVSAVDIRALYPAISNTSTLLNGAPGSMLVLLHHTFVMMRPLCPGLQRSRSD